MDDANQAADYRIRRTVRQRLESLQRAGVETVPKLRVTPTAQPAAPANSDVTVAAPPPEPPPAQVDMPSKAAAKAKPAHVGDLADRTAALEVIRREVCGCPRCPVLVENRTQTVFGVGDPAARVCFFGEAPGADEDACGEPFVGRAGQLLDKIIEATTMKREQVYILNVLKCRPPNNRPPQDDEIANCREYFERQLAIIRPQYIVCLGATAAKALLQTTWSIGKLRGKFHQYQEAKVLATYHPAYLLRNPAAKADVWEDMKLLMKEMGIALPKK